MLFCPYGGAKRPGARFLALLLLTGLLAGPGCARRTPRPDTLVVLGDMDVEGLDPHLSGAVWQTLNVLLNLYEPLVTADPQMSLAPALAVAWSNPDERTWVFQLRQGVSFHTGGVLDAEDVVFSLLRARDHERSALRASLAGVEDVRALPGGRVQIKTARPDAVLAARLKDVLIASRRFLQQNGEGAAQATSCGTGPYRLVARAAGATVDLERFPAYWRGPAPIARARFLARRYGDPDVPRYAPPPARLLFAAVPGTPKYEQALAENAAHFAPSLSVAYLSWDLQHLETPRVTLPGGGKGNPFLDPRVREAIARALSLEEVRALRRNEGFSVAQLFPRVVFGFDPTLPLPSHDVEEAKRLMARTPFASGFEVELDVREVMSSYESVIERDLLPLGIRVKTRRRADRDFFETLSSGGSSFYVLRFSCRSGDAQEFFDKWVHSKDGERRLGGFNFSYDRNPVEGLDAEIDEARREMDVTRRRVKLQQVTRRVMEARLALPLLNEKDHTMTSADVVWTPRADTFRILYDARFR